MSNDFPEKMIFTCTCIRQLQKVLCKNICRDKKTDKEFTSLLSAILECYLINLILLLDVVCIILNFSGFC